MKLITLLLLIMCTVAIFAKKSGKLTHSNASESSKIYQFKLKDIEGEEFDFSQFKDNVILIVNVAIVIAWWFPW